MSSTTTAAAAAVPSAVKPARRFPPPCWTQDEALALIQAYKERWYALRRGYLRTADWDAVAEDVGRMCPGATPPKTSAQCRHKMEKLRQRYRAEKQRAISFSGGQFLSTWFYFEAMDSMERNGNGNGSNADEETNAGNDLNSKVNHQLNVSVGDSVYGGLNPGRGIRFKPFAADDNQLVTIASRANTVRALQNYSHEEVNDDEFDDVCYNETLIGKNLGKMHRSSSQSYASRFQSDHHTNDGLNYQNMEHSGVRPRKMSKIGYWNENGENGENGENDDNDLGGDDYYDKYGDRINRGSEHFYYDGESEFSRGVKRDNNSIGQIVSSIKLLADGFVRMEKMKMDMVHEIERMRMEAEMKRNKLLLESQKQIVEAFVKGLSENKRQQQ